jgi:hypothetical protein
VHMLLGDGSDIACLHSCYLAVAFSASLILAVRLHVIVLSHVRVTLDRLWDWRLDLLTTYWS